MSSFQKQSTENFHEQAQSRQVRNGKKIRYVKSPSYIPSFEQKFENVNLLDNSSSCDYRSRKGFTSCCQYLHRSKFGMILICVAMFMMGVVVGFIPFIKVYVDSCQDDRRILQKMVNFFDTNNGSFSKGHMSSEPTIYIGHAKGNNDIVLECSGEIEIQEIEYSGIASSKESKEKVSEYCKEHLQKAFNNVRCVVSLKKVYQAPYDEESFTQISYTCKLPTNL
ncbi:uncharacterized protein LOC100209497 isoform X1 [Hydra vulgaris]|uniref:uncharacterized protein LOC100209497 isoform X1 n=1 Tax=Hydra vulgaris TaxID=6087 RepID=UPI0001925D7F|nr:uncharacterized protein LOC100209497 [Hydra vulgaris]